MPEEYLTPSQAAKELGVTRQTILSYVDRGLLRAIKVGPRKYTKVIKSGVENYLIASEVNPSRVTPEVKYADDIFANFPPVKKGGAQ